jgi:hypothetical protein
VVFLGGGVVSLDAKDGFGEERHSAKESFPFGDDFAG